MDDRAGRPPTGATIADIADFLDAGDRLRRLSEATDDLLIDRLTPVSEGKPGAVAFLTASAAAAFTPSPPGPSLLILDRRADVDDDVLRNAGIDAVVTSDNARLEFIRVARRFFVAPPPTGIHPSAVIASSAVLEPDVSVGPLCTIGERCSLGRGSRLEAGVHLYDDVLVGRNVHIHAGAVIGADGFGYERDDDGVLEQFPHFGSVEIGDDVDIGANACIDRAALGMTRIGRGSKIDNLVHIAHNVRIGEGAVVIAHAMVGGSTRIGDGAWVSPSACLRDNLSIGEGATVGLAAVVTKDVPDGATVVGSPARDITEHRALLTAWRSLIATRET